MAFASPTLADTDFTALTPRERAVFHSEIRAVFQTNPELARPRRMVPGYEEDIARDIDQIGALAPRLFGPDLPGFGAATARQHMALFVEPDCPACVQAETALRTMAQTHDLRVTLVNAPDAPELVQKLGIDALPFYVFPKMMLRGHIPDIVLDRYLAQHTGQ